MDNDRAGHYDQMYKDGHTGKLYTYITKKEKIQMVEHKTKIMIDNLMLSLFFHTQSRKVNMLTLFTCTIPVNRSEQLLHCYRTTAGTTYPFIHV